jgi:hypothetical protein
MLSFVARSETGCDSGRASDGLRTGAVLPSFVPRQHERRCLYLQTFFSLRSGYVGESFFFFCRLMWVCPSVLYLGGRDSFGGDVMMFRERPLCRSRSPNSALAYPLSDFSLNPLFIILSPNLFTRSERDRVLVLSLAPTLSFRIPRQRVRWEGLL